MIIRHEDKSDVAAWAKQAFAFPLSYFAMIGLVRKWKANAKLDKYIKEHPEPGTGAL
ncbi:hypothetical protein D3C83_269860 [compost metagenome]